MKIRFSWWWLPYGIFLTYFDMWKTAGFLAAILALHELAHVAVAKCFHYETSTLMIYPFGFGAEIKQMGNGSIWKETLILLAGPSVHLLVPFGIVLLMKYHIISTEYGNYLSMLNQAVCIFNLLPIYPLDGGRILQNLCQLILPYQWGFGLCLFLSCFFIIWLYQAATSYSFQIVLLFLLFQEMMAVIHIKQIQEAFWWYRYLHPKTGYLIQHRHSDLFRAFRNEIKVHQNYYKEEEWLKNQLAQHKMKKHEQSTQIML